MIVKVAPPVRPPTWEEAYQTLIKELNMSKFIEVTHAEKKILLNTKYIDGVRIIGGTCYINCRDKAQIEVSETYEQVKEMLIDQQPGIDDLRTKPRHQNGG